MSTDFAAPGQDTQLNLTVSDGTSIVFHQNLVTVRLCAELESISAVHRCHLRCAACLDEIPVNIELFCRYKPRSSQAYIKFQRLSERNEGLPAKCAPKMRSDDDDVGVGVLRRDFEDGSTTPVPCKMIIRSEYSDGMKNSGACEPEMRGPAVLGNNAKFSLESASFGLCAGSRTDLTSTKAVKHVTQGSVSSSFVKYSGHYPLTDLAVFRLQSDRLART